MRLFLYGKTAAQWWAHARGFDRAGDAARFDASALRDCAPTARSVCYLAETLPFISSPVHVLVSSRRDLRSLAGARVHHSAYPYPPGSFACVAPGIYAPCPELCFIQLSGQLSLLQTVKEGYSLCGSFTLDESARFGLESRIPLTSIDMIRDYGIANSSLRGSSAALARLRWVKEGSASPRESDLAMRLTLPVRLGGFGFRGAILNHRIDPGKRAAALTDNEFFVADICWPEAKLVVEYDSNAHLSPEILAHDAQKRGALEADGYMVVTVTKLQLDDPGEMFRIAYRIARRLGRRLRIQVPDFPSRQTELFQLGHSSMGHSSTN